MYMHAHNILFTTATMNGAKMMEKRRKEKTEKKER